ncbi:MAG: lysophospholipid acyltransferase family protein [Gemmatimonadaceae bacterium]
MNINYSVSPPPRSGSAPSRLSQLGRAVRSSAFIVAYFLSLVLVLGTGQRILIWPAIVFFPGRRRGIIRAWLALQAQATLAIARGLAGVRVTVRGAISPEACVVVMNHQSVLDIPLGIALVPGPYPLIPTRDRYSRGLPGISPLARMARFPFVSQGRTATRAELLAIRDAADQVARGEQSLIIYPEGHRTHDGLIADFMKPGLKLILSRAKHPVYCIVADGMWHARTFADAALRFAGTSVSVTVLGPFQVPEPHQIDSFIDELRTRMIEALAQIRNEAK